MNRPTITSERLLKVRPLLNAFELCRRSQLPFHRLDNARRGRSKLTEEELERITQVLAELEITPDHPIRRE